MVDLNTIWLIGIVPAIFIYGVISQILAYEDDCDLVERFLFGAMACLVGVFWWLITPFVLGSLLIIFTSNKIIKWIDSLPYEENNADQLLNNDCSARSQ